MRTAWQPGPEPTYDAEVSRSWGHAGLVLLLVASCGRIGIDQLGTDAAIDGQPGADVATDAATCPPETVAITDGAAVCIELAERGTLSWTEAVATCGALGRRLCSDAEWATACTNAPGLIDMINDNGGASPEWEWVADMTGGVAGKRGYLLCGDISTHAVTDPYDFRCCADR